MNEATLRAAARHASVLLGVNTARAHAVLRDTLAGLLAAAASASEPPAQAERQQHPGRQYVAEALEADRRARRGSYVRVPALAKSEHGAPLRRVIGRAADEAGVSHYQAALLMTWVWQAIADEVACGEVVRVPGWGAYGPWLRTPRPDRGRRGVPGREAVYPRFVAARPFRQAVRDGCLPCRAQNRVLANLQRSHHPSSRPDQAGSRTCTAMRAWRDDIGRLAGHSVRGAARPSPGGASGD